MKRTFMVLGLTLICLVLMDVIVAFALGWAERTGRFGSLVTYFEYGRSVPGKLARWEDNPDPRGNLYDAAWRETLIEQSHEAFLAEPEEEGPVIRSYGMSFVNNILRSAVELRPDLVWDGHSGPGAPPNFTYALFEEDRDNRKAGDVVILGILSSAVPAMAALSNRTWAFEQPAPFTYPVYWPDGEGLVPVEPLINSSEEERSLRADPAVARRWARQLAEDDAFYAWPTFGAPWLDVSPFARLVRRSLAISDVAKTEADILSGSPYPYAEVLRRMIRSFSETARSDGQIPIVFLIQSRDPGDADLLVALQSVLNEEEILYLATAMYFDPRDPSGFLPDGHYAPGVDRTFAEAFLEMLER